jgi:hypothetical protein
MTMGGERKCAGSVGSGDIKRNIAKPLARGRARVARGGAVPRDTVRVARGGAMARATARVAWVGAMTKATTRHRSRPWEWEAPRDGDKRNLETKGLASDRTWVG